MGENCPREMPDRGLAWAGNPLTDARRTAAAAEACIAVLQDRAAGTDAARALASQRRAEAEAALLHAAKGRRAVISALARIETARPVLAAAEQQIMEAQRQIVRANARAETARTEADHARTEADRAWTEAARLLAAFRAIETSTSWLVTYPLRRMLSPVPHAGRRQLRRALRLAWWTITLQARKRLRVHRQAEPPPAAPQLPAPPDDDRGESRSPRRQLDLPGRTSSASIGDR